MISEKFLRQYSCINVQCNSYVMRVYKYHFMYEPCTYEFCYEKFMIRGNYVAIRHKNSLTFDDI